MWAARLLFLGTLLVLLCEVDGKKKKKKKKSAKDLLMPAPLPLTEGEINDLLESKPVSYMKAQGCSDEVGACVSDPVCSHELKAAATLPEDGSAEKPTGGGELLTKLITCGDVAMKKQKDDDQKLMKEVFEKYPSYEKAGKAYGKAKEAENLVQRRFDHRTQKTPTEFLMKSAIAHLNALEAIKALTPVEEVEPPVWRIFFEEMASYLSVMQNEANRLLAMPVLGGRERVEKARAKEKKRQAKFDAQMQKAKAQTQQGPKDL